MNIKANSILKAISNKKVVIFIFFLIFMLTYIKFMINYINTIVSIVNSNSYIWGEARLIVNKIGLKKKIIACEQCKSLGRIESIAFGNFRAAHDPEIAIIFNNDIVFLNPTSFDFQSKINYKSPINDDESRSFYGGQSLVKLANGDLAIAWTGGGFSRVALTDLNGHFIWKFADDNYHTRDNLLHADLDNDGKEELYVGSEDGIYRINLEGKVEWFYPAKNVDITLIKKTDTNDSRIMTSNEAGHIFLDPNGKFIRREDARSIYSKGISNIMESSILVKQGNLLSFYNSELEFKSSYFFEFPVYHGPYSTYFQLEKETEQYIATLFTSQEMYRKYFSLISIFDNKGELVFQEIIDGINENIISMPSKLGESLLIGKRNGKLLVYTR